MFGQKKAILKIFVEQLQSRLFTSDASISISNFVTNSEYQIFLNYMREEEGRYYLPDHWRNYSFEEHIATEPIVGIRGADGLTFCRWLNYKFSSSGVFFRLPTIQEMVKEPAHPQIATWCYDGYRLKSFGLTTESIENIRQMLSNYIQAPLSEITTQYLMQDHFDNIAYHLGFDAANSMYPETVHLHNLSGALSTAIDFISNSIENVTSRNLIGVATSYDIAYAFDLSKASGIALSRDQTSALATYKKDAYYRFSYAGFNQINQAIEENDFGKATKLIADLAKSAQMNDRSWAKLLDCYLMLLTAESKIEIRYAYRKYVAVVAKLILTGFAIHKILDLEIGYANSTIERGLKLKQREKELREMNLDKLILNYNPKNSTNVQIVQQLYWQITLLIAQEEGHLPVWEGLRIVAEKT